MLNSLSDKIEIVYEDDDIVVVHKPVGLASQKTTGNTAFIDLDAKGWKLLHRLDQRVSGLMLFAKSDAALVALNNAFKNNQVKKLYKAVVANAPKEHEARLTHWLLKDGKLNKSKVFAKEVAHSQKAELHYRLVSSSLKYHLLEVELFTGRFHQIRAQLAFIGSPIVGDVKYGFKRTTPDGSIFLQSYKIEFLHPISKEQLIFEIEIPELWKKYGF